MTQTMSVAYIMSRFPTVTETFILYEMCELERMGVQVEVFPLIHQRDSVMHHEAKSFDARAYYARLFSRETLAAQLYWLRTRPRAYVRAWWRGLRGNIFSMKFLARAFVIIPTAAWFARTMETIGISHVHAHWATHPALAAYIIHLLTGLPYSITAHAHDIFVDRTMLAEKLAHARFVVTISNYNRRMFRELYGSSIDQRVVVVHCGIDPAKFAPGKNHEPEKPLTIVCVGRLQKRKGHMYLVEACARLREAGVSFECLIVGDGPERSVLESAVTRLGLDGLVTLMGNQTHDRVRDLVGQADVVVLPSITTPTNDKEGIPVALMEALAAERAVVSTRQSGIPELVNHEYNGLLVPERDSEALFAALHRLATHPELRVTFGQAGREKVSREFNLAYETAKLHRLLTYQWNKAPLPPDQVLLD